MNIPLNPPIVLADGKYTVLDSESGALTALRYNEPWRDLCGDNLVYCLAHHIWELEKKIADHEDFHPTDFATD